MLKNRKVCVGNLGFLTIEMLKNRKVCVGNLGFLTFMNSYI